MADPAAGAGTGAADRAAAVVDRLTACSQTLATAESLTGGRLCAALVDVPGASAVVRGGVVAYAAEVKTGVLGVSPELVAAHGTVSAETATAMAGRVRELFAADWGVATTGVAGPDPAEGHPPGRVHVAVAGPPGVVDAVLDLDGDRSTVRTGTVEAAVVLLLDVIQSRHAAASPPACQSRRSPVSGTGSGYR